MSSHKRHDSVHSSSSDGEGERGEGVQDEGGSPFRPGPRSQSRGRPGALDHFARMNLNDPQTPQRPQTRSHTFPEPPGAPHQSSHQQHLLRIHHEVDHVGEAVPAILLEFLARCEPNTKYSATLNDAAKKARFDQIPWKAHPWIHETMDKHSLPDLFAKAVTRYHQLLGKTIADWDPRHDVQRLQQQPKLLLLEGDVADS